MRRALAGAVILAGLALSPAALASRTCHEVSDIVGHQKCTRYGHAWSTEDNYPITLGFGARYLSFAPEGTTFKGALKRDGKVTNVAYDSSALGTAPLGGGGFGLRITGFVLPFIYAGIEYGITLGHNERAGFSAGGATFEPTGKLVDTFGFGGGGLVGLRLPLGPISVRGEVLFGGYTLSLMQSVVKGTLESNSVPMGASTWAIEPRVAVDLWATPWMTVSGSYGRNVVDHGSQTAALTLTWHVRSFDGSALF